MPRRKAAIKREVLPDPLYGSERVTKFINVVMRKGKKSIAERIVYDAIQATFDRLKKEKGKEEVSGGEEAGKGGKAGNKVRKSVGATSAASKTQTAEALDVLDRALGNVSPTVEVKSRRVGGATYQVPVEVTSDRGMALAM